MTERWEPIPGFAGYEASSLGRVRSIDRTEPFKNSTRFRPGRVLRTRRDRYGYARVNLSVTAIHMTYAVHVLVALAFLGPPSSAHEVAHWDGNKNNNVPSNLRWATVSENNADKERHGRLRLTTAQVREIRAALARGVQQRTLARNYAVCPQTINNIARGRSWKQVAA